MLAYPFARGGRATRRRRPVSGSFKNRVLFHTQTPAYFSFRRITRIADTAHPRRVARLRVSLAGKAAPALLSACAIHRHPLPTCVGSIDLLHYPRRVRVDLKAGRYSVLSGCLAFLVHNNGFVAKDTPASAHATHNAAAQSSVCLRAEVV